MPSVPCRAIPIVISSVLAKLKQNYNIITLVVGNCIFPHAEVISDPAFPSQRQRGRLEREAICNKALHAGGIFEVSADQTAESS